MNDDSSKAFSIGLKILLRFFIRRSLNEFRRQKEREKEKRHNP
jgi:hypothetical protein